ncbi:MAG: hypothetical protein P8M58_02140 [Candidatus Marinimicrobia bacterium]|nr:hypothetical protein [Candidatus Neomarinimicrobiota bacterium]MDG2366351.1 hypothetical protein [Candidatus Neomarinimicrobiota bacterium]
MLTRISNPRSKIGRFLLVCLISSLILGISGCANSPRLEKPPASIARAMETKAFPGDLKTVLKASINSLQDMDYTISVLNSDVGLITANRTTEYKKTELASENTDEGMSDGQKACLAVGAITLIAIVIGSILDGDGDGNDSSPMIFNDNDDGPDGPKIYRYRITINLTELENNETNVRVSASGEVEQDGKILSTGGVHELEFFQKFFNGMKQGLFLDQNLPINN